MSEIFGFGLGPRRNDIGQGLQDIQDLADQIRKRQVQEAADKLDATRRAPVRRPATQDSQEEGDPFELRVPGSGPIVQGPDSEDIVGRLRDRLSPEKTPGVQVDGDAEKTTVRRPSDNENDGPNVHALKSFDQTRLSDALTSTGSQFERALADRLGTKPDLSTYENQLNRNAQERGRKSQVMAHRAELEVRRADKEKSDADMTQYRNDTLKQRSEDRASREKETEENRAARVAYQKSVDSDRDRAATETNRHNMTTEDIQRSQVPIKQQQADQGQHRIEDTEDENLKKGLHQISKAVDDSAGSQLQTFRDLGNLIEKGETPAGPIKGGFAAFQTDPNARKIIQEAQSLYNPYIKKFAGVAVNDREQENIKRALGMIGFGKTRQDFEVGLELMRRSLDSSLSQAYSGVGDDAARVWIKKTGLAVRNHPVYGPPGKGSIWQGAPTPAEQRWLKSQGQAQSTQPQQVEEARASSPGPHPLKTSVDIKEPGGDVAPVPAQTQPQRVRVKDASGRLGWWDGVSPLPPGVSRAEEQ